MSNRSEGIIILKKETTLDVDLKKKIVETDLTATIQGGRPYQN